MNVSPPATDLLWSKEKGNIIFLLQNIFLFCCNPFASSKFVISINLVKYHTVELLLTKLDENSRRATLYTFINPEYCIAPMA